MLFLEISNTDGYDLVRDIFHKANKFRSWHDLIVYYAKSFGENMLFDVYLNENNILSVRKKSSTHFSLLGIKNLFCAL